MPPTGACSTTEVNLHTLLWVTINQRAFKRVSLDVFGHLLQLDLDFHLHRKTGQVLRILERGVSSVQVRARATDPGSRA